jgi:hypothetical protein
MGKHDRQATIVVSLDEVKLVRLPTPTLALSTV